jgi:pyruvate carboxylase
MVIEAMKMETTVISKVNGTVDKIYVKDGEEVNEDTLLVSFIIDMEEQPEEVHPELPEMDFTTLEKDEFKTVDVTEEENK